MRASSRGRASTETLHLQSVHTRMGQQILSKFKVSQSRAFFWFKEEPISAFTFKNLLRHFAKWALTHSK